MKFETQIVNVMPISYLLRGIGTYFGREIAW
jgi:hypothetical protein